MTDSTDVIARPPKQSPAANAPEPSVKSTASLNALWTTIEQRKAERPAGSYTVELLDTGQNEILKKIGEEAVEVILAAASEGDDRLLYEMADLFYHSLVLLAARDMQFSAREAELARRFK